MTKNRQFDLCKNILGDFRVIRLVLSLFATSRDFLKVKIAIGHSNKIHWCRSSLFSTSSAKKWKSKIFKFENFSLIFKNLKILPEIFKMKISEENPEYKGKI